MRRITLFDELMGLAPGELKGPRPELRPDTEVYFFLESGHVMEYFSFDCGAKMPVLFYGPGEFVLPSYFGLSCFEDLDSVVRQPVTYGQVIRALRNYEGANLRYCDLQLQWFKKVEAFLQMRAMTRPLERYLHLTATQPWVLELAMQSDVAQYLEISQLLLALFRIGMTPIPAGHKNSP